MYGKKCNFCGGPLDRRGKLCKTCSRILGTKFNRENLRIITDWKVTITQKHKCMKCPDLEACLRITKLSRDMMEIQEISKVMVRT